MAFGRLLGNVVVTEEKRVRECHRLSANLVVAFVVPEEEQLVFLYRSADRCTILLPNKEGILKPGTRCRVRIRAKYAARARISRSLESRERCHVVISEKDKTATMKIVAAGSRDDVHRSG